MKNMLERFDGWGRTVPKGITKVALQHVRNGLDCMHRADIIHCDLKPENVFFCRRSGVFPESLASHIN